jgi:imidazolonepropionase-like amidohydrolase
MGFPRRPGRTLSSYLYLRTVVMGLFVIGLAVSAGAAADRPFAVHAKAYIDKDGSTVEGATLLVEHGKIAAIGPDVNLPEDCLVLERPDATICPGFVDVHVTLGTLGRTGEAAHAIEPEADAADLFNRYHHDFDRAVRAGVTTVLLAPASTHLVGGRTLVVKTAGEDNQARVLGPGPIKLSLAGAAFTTRRPPTSLQGGLDELRRMIEAARADRSDESAFARWARGETTAIVDTVGESELTSLAGLATTEGVKCAALHANYAVERLADVKALGQPVILGTYEFSDPMRLTRTPAILAREGIRFALTSNAPRFGPELLRVGAAIAIAQGLDAAGAYEALTTVPATIAGVDERVGSLEAGKDADFILFAGSPIDLTSRIEEVFVDGRRVYRVAPASGRWESTGKMPVPQRRPAADRPARPSAGRAD